MRTKTTQSTNKLTKMLIVVSIGLLGCWFAGLFGSSLHAQSAIPLIVAPARQTLTADPGKSVNFAVRFYNTGTEPISGTFKTADFIVNNSEGSPNFLEGPTTLSKRFAASEWVSLSTDKGTIPAAGMITVQGSVKVPSDANPGGKYFAVFFEPVANIPSPSGARQEESSGVSVRIAGLVYLRVSGPITEGATVTKFMAPGFLEYGPIDITTEIKNYGDYHITPKGDITVKDMFGRVVAKETLKEVNIFPDASRQIVTKIGTKWMLGRFTANLNAAYGESGNVPLSSTLAFWVFPWKLAVVIILAIIILILIGVIVSNKTGKKQKELEKELTEEKEELEKLKDQLKDKISEVTDSPIPTEEKK